MLYTTLLNLIKIINVSKKFKISTELISGPIVKSPIVVS